jgi:hypothetical protein
MGLPLHYAALQLSNYTYTYMCKDNQLLIYNDHMFKIDYRYMCVHNQLLTYTYMSVGSV